ncbi:hypothetical protein MIND_00774500 [Mycena indigotica]|uniref:Uncharacterized protein n=1 Tax=Mycena indigotica TaxID=2126181 RepID=A0A8H6SN45_9AGAR|nr:uncharacterized protein MIND_00774500 [Mycena indigotica]KAF7302078.1 hypothetical protein MIND_00774500 [Mycena indigotica]
MFNNGGYNTAGFIPPPLSLPRTLPPNFGPGVQVPSRASTQYMNPHPLAPQPNLQAGRLPPQLMAVDEPMPMASENTPRFRTNAALFNDPEYLNLLNRSSNPHSPSPFNYSHRQAPVPAGYGPQPPAFAHGPMGGFPASLPVQQPDTTMIPSYGLDSHDFDPEPDPDSRTLRWIQSQAQFISTQVLRVADSPDVPGSKQTNTDFMANTNLQVPGYTSPHVALDGGAAWTGVAPTSGSQWHSNPPPSPYSSFPSRQNQAPVVGPGPLQSNLNYHTPPHPPPPLAPHNPTANAFTPETASHLSSGSFQPTTASRNERTINPPKFGRAAYLHFRDTYGSGAAQAVGTGSGRHTHTPHIRSPLGLSQTQPVAGPSRPISLDHAPHNSMEFSSTPTSVNIPPEPMLVDEERHNTASAFTSSSAAESESDGSDSEAESETSTERGGEPATAHEHHPPLPRFSYGPSGLPPRLQKEYDALVEGFRQQLDRVSAQLDADIEALAVHKTQHDASTVDSQTHWDWQSKAEILQKMVESGRRQKGELTSIVDNLKDGASGRQA